MGCWWRLRDREGERGRRTSLNQSVGPRRRVHCWLREYSGCEHGHGPRSIRCSESIPFPVNSITVRNPELKTSMQRCDYVVRVACSWLADDRLCNAQYRTQLVKRRNWWSLGKYQNCRYLFSTFWLGFTGIHVTEVVCAGSSRRQHAGGKQVGEINDIATFIHLKPKKSCHRVSLNLKRVRCRQASNVSQSSGSQSWR